jgi:nicotinamide mononucleotide adenylyltransferase
VSEAVHPRRRYAAVAVTGRFQPFHNDHLALVLHALALAPRVVIGITNPDAADCREHPASAHRHLPAANPYSFEQRASLIAAAMSAAGVPPGRAAIVPFPLETPLRWSQLLPPGTAQLVRVFSDWEREKVRRFEAAGFPVIVLQGDSAGRLSATQVRAALSGGAPWQQWVPPGARELLAAWHAGTPALREATGA